MDAGEHSSSETFFWKGLPFHLTNPEVDAEEGTNELDEKTLRF